DTIYMSMVTLPKEQESNYNLDLFESLRQLRMTFAKENNIPPYVVFTDSTLRDIARYLPDHKEAMLSIKGIGEKRYEQFGEQFLKLVLDFRAQNPDLKGSVLIQARSGVQIKRDISIDPSYLQSYKLFQSGK